MGFNTVNSLPLNVPTHPISSKHNQFSFMYLLYPSSSTVKGETTVKRGSSAPSFTQNRASSSTFFIDSTSSFSSSSISEL